MRKRYGRKVDANQKAVKHALEAIGVRVYEIEEPFDLLLEYRSQWHVMEVKNRETHARRKGGGLMTDKQLEILAVTEAPVLCVYSPDDAIELVTRGTSKATGTEG